MKKIALKKGEGKWVTFSISRGGLPLPVDGLTFKFAVKKDLAAASYAIEKNDDVFDKALAANGIIRVNISSTDTKSMETGGYSAELKIIFAADTDVDKGKTIPFEILPAIISD